MEISEFPYDFGAVTMNTAAAFSLMPGTKSGDGTYIGLASVPGHARIAYAIVRNATTGNVTVGGTNARHTILPGERKHIAFSYPGVKFFTVIPTVTTTAGQLTADVGIAGAVQ